MEAGNLTLRTLQAEDTHWLRVAWDWMRAQPELYSDDVGYDDYQGFLTERGRVKDFSLLCGESMIGLASLYWRRPQVCEFGLITPRRPRVRQLFSLLQVLEDAYFTSLQYHTYYVSYPDDHRYDRPRKLALLWGFRPIGDKLDYLEITAIDYWRKKHGE